MTSVMGYGFQGQGHSVIGSADQVTLNGWYAGDAYHVQELQSSDGKTLLDSQVQALVDAMASFDPPAMGQITLPDSYRTRLDPVLAANWN